jgi:hypothetical protein
MKALTDYPTPETKNCIEQYLKHTLKSGNDMLVWKICESLERRLAACREALEMIATFHIADGQCDNGYGPKYNASEALRLTEPLA